MNTKYDFNLVVIGAGSGGLVSAYLAAAFGAKVALIEKDKMGGDCLNTGCVPSKTFIRMSKVANLSQRAKHMGFEKIDVQFQFSSVMEQVQKVIKQIEPHDSVERYTSLGVNCIQGEAKFLDPHTVEVNGQKITARSFIIATGGRPLVPPFKGLEHIEYLTSDSIWKLQEAPENLVVLGGGPIGCELAQAFQRLGSTVHLIERSEQILAKEDSDAAEYVYQQMKNDGVQIHTQTTAAGFSKEGDSSFILLEDNHTKEISKLKFDKVLFALGRRPNSQSLNLEKINVELNPNQTIKVNEFLAATTQPHIFACGDVAGPYQFTHTAAHQAYYACINAIYRPLLRWVPNFLKGKLKVSYKAIPWVTFTAPEVGTVGLNEKAAKEQNIPYQTFKYDLAKLDRGLAEAANSGFVKVITCPKTHKLLGATCVGSHSGEVLAELTLAIQNDLNLNHILGTIHPYPTWSEATKFAAAEWKRSTLSPKLQKFSKKLLARWI